MTTRDRVAQMYGQEIADQLEAAGLLASVQQRSGLTPTHWRLDVVDPFHDQSKALTRQQLHNLSNELCQPLWKYVYVGHMTDVMAASQVFTSETGANRQAKMATKLGLLTTITPLAWVEVTE